MRVIAGVSIHDLHVNSDVRGELVAIDASENAPFPPRRVFFVHVDDVETTRGGHANSCDEFIIALSGAVTVTTDNGYEQSSVRLSSRRRGLWVKPGVVINLEDFQPKTILLVCAAADYCDTKHYSCPQPHLFLMETV